LPFFFLEERGRPTFIPRNSSFARILLDIINPYQLVSLRPAGSTRPEPFGPVGGTTSPEPN